MFNKNHIGRRVISKTHGEGIITQLAYDDTNYPVKVLFIHGDGHSDWYTKDGYISTDGEESDENIVLLPSKKGSKDARKIVAMLAVEYREAKVSSDFKRNTSHRISRVNAIWKVYQQAKQLLGEE